MNDTLKMGFILSVVCIVAAGTLSQVYSITKVKIDKNMVELLEKKRKEVLPAAAIFEEQIVDGKPFFIGKDVEGNTVGSIISVAPRGYAGPINILIGISMEGKVASVSITKLDQQETPGLGTKVTAEKFRNQFKGKDGRDLLLKKDGGTVDAITAATISSRAVANGIVEGMEWYRKNVKF